MPCAPMFPKLWAMDEGGFVSVLRRPDTCPDQMSVGDRML